MIDGDRCIHLTDRGLELFFFSFLLFEIAPEVPGEGRRPAIAVLTGNVFGVVQPALPERSSRPTFPVAQAQPRQHHGSLPAPRSHELHASPPGSYPSPNALADNFNLLAL